MYLCATHGVLACLSQVAPQGTRVPSADIWSAVSSAGAGRVSSESTAPSVKAAGHAARGRPEAGAGQWFHARAQPVPCAPCGRERGRSPPASHPARLGSSDGLLQPKVTGVGPRSERLLAKQARRTGQMHTQQMWGWRPPRHRLQWRPPPGSPRDRLLTPGPEGPRGPWSSRDEWELPEGRGVETVRGRGTPVWPRRVGCVVTLCVAAAPSGASG